MEGHQVAVGVLPSLGVLSSLGEEGGPSCLVEAPYQEGQVVDVGVRGQGASLGVWEACLGVLQVCSWVVAVAYRVVGAYQGVVGLGASWVALVAYQVAEACHREDLHGFPEEGVGDDLGFRGVPIMGEVLGASSLLWDQP